MTKLKSAEYWVNEWHNPKRELRNIDLMKAIQQNAIEAALEVAAEEGKVWWIDSSESAIDKQSITSLINHKDLKL